MDFTFLRHLQMSKTKKERERETERQRKPLQVLKDMSILMDIALNSPVPHISVSLETFEGEASGGRFGGGLANCVKVSS